MASSRLTKAILRGAGAVPFLFVAIWCFITMEPDKILAVSQPAADSGFIEWDGGRLRILDRFHGVEALDQGLRGATATFAPSTLGYDSIGSWQFFQFLVDLSPVYATLFLESSRPANAWSPAYFANEGLAGPMIFLFHTSVVFAMFLAPDPAARHYWTWAWQLSPLWIGLGNLVAGQVVRLVPQLKGPSPKQMLGLLSLVSSGMWIYTLAFSPHSLSTLFVPEAGDQSGLILHMRKALQADEIGAVVGILLWLAYSFFDLYAAGLIGGFGLLNIILAPVAALCVGPGATLALGWYIREGILTSVSKS